MNQEHPDQRMQEKINYLPQTVACIKQEMAKVADNFEHRAKQILMFNQRSHTSNTQQRKNMEIMHEIWCGAAVYVRQKIKEL